MFTRNLILAASLSAILFSISANAVIGPIKITLNPTTVSSNYFNEDDTLAPFSSEVYTQDDIENSKSSNIYDFLTQNTSLSLAPSSGNKFSQSIAARGYGLTIGSYNLVVTLNGRRLNNIDTSGSDINVVNINNVDKIEITKGSGSVMYGDSATAGAIHIYTKKNYETKISTSLGNYGLVQSSASFGINQDKIGLNMSIDDMKHGGYSVADSKNNRDKGDQTKSNIGINYKTNTETEYQFGYEKYNVNNRYPNNLTLSQFNENPSINGTGYDYTFREVSSNTVNLNVKRPITDNLILIRNQSITNKDTKNTAWYNSSPSLKSYDTINSDYILTYKNKNIKIDSGISFTDATRTSIMENHFKKDNSGIFSQLQFTNNNTIYSIGARKEKVEYEYRPISTGGIKELPVKSGKHNLDAYNIGVNTRINPRMTIFSNLNKAFQAPLIDRFFSYDGTFNGFMKPSTSQTLNFGLNYLTDSSKTKATLFRSNVKNEMYLCKSSAVSVCSYFGDNLNIDKSHKQGLEIQNKIIFNPNWSTDVNYAYTIAEIDEENSGSGILNGKTNPMTSKHNISASIRYSLNEKANMTLTQKFRSEAFAADDYSNSHSQKQKAYKSTNFNFTYNSNDDLEFKFDIENMFKNSYGTWIKDNAIYPGNFTRNIKAGFSYKF